MANRTLAAYLADLPEVQLLEMRGNIRARRSKLAEEDGDLAVEERLVTDALSRKSRRAPSAGGRVTRDQVFDIVTDSFIGQFKVAQAKRVMDDAGVEMTAENLRQHLRRLVADRKLDRDGPFYFSPRSPQQPNGADNGAGHTQTFPETVTSAEGKDER
jgi:hypothetical protein